MKKSTFYALSFTWGLPLTLAGGMVLLILRLCGIQSFPFGWCRAVKLGRRWGGVNIGLLLVSDRTSGSHVLLHEHGHALQNACLGPLMPFLVCLPSSLRFHWRNICTKLGHPPKSIYDSVWFERQATQLGQKYRNEWMK